MIEIILSTSSGVSSLNGLEGGLTIASSGSLTVGTSGSDINVNLNLANANIWTATQTFSAIIDLSNSMNLTVGGGSQLPNGNSFIGYYENVQTVGDGMYQAFWRDNGNYLAPFLGEQNNAFYFGFVNASSTAVGSLAGSTISTNMVIGTGGVLQTGDTTTAYPNTGLTVSFTPRNTLDDGSGNMTIAGQFDAAHGFDTTNNVGSASASSWIGAISMGSPNNIFTISTGRDTLIIAAIAVTTATFTTTGTIYWQNLYGNMYMALVASGATIECSNNARWFWIAL